MTDVTTITAGLPEVHVIESDTKKVEIELTPHGPVVNVTSSLIKAGIVGMGLLIAAHANADLLHVLSGLGISGGALYTLIDSIVGSNRATKKLMQEQPA